MGLAISLDPRSMWSGMDTAAMSSTRTKEVANHVFVIASCDAAAENLVALMVVAFTRAAKCLLSNHGVNPAIVSFGRLAHVKSYTCCMFLLCFLNHKRNNKNTCMNLVSRIMKVLIFSL